MALIDARDLAGSAPIDCDVCIIGAGAAGITLARELAGTKARVVLLEAGGDDYSNDSQRYYAGRSVGREYLDLTQCRLRYFGGTTNHWDGWCLPLDDIDFQPRPGLPHCGWPIDAATLAPFYRRAATVCELPRDDFRPDTWGINSGNVPAPFAGPQFVAKIIQQSPPTRFGERYRQDLLAADNIDIYLHAPVVNIAANDAGTAVRHLTIAPTPNRQIDVAARYVVLATGGIENARLLLASNDVAATGLGNQHDLVGRYFMVHVETWPAQIQFAQPKSLTELNRMVETIDPDDRYAPFAGPSASLMQANKLANCRILFGVTWTRQSPGVEAIKHLLGMHGGKSRGLVADLGNIAADFDDVVATAYRRYFKRLRGKFDAMTLFFHSEQLPNPDSRITIGSQRDALGLPQTIVDWRLSDADKRSLKETLRLLGMEVGRTGFGRLQMELSDAAGGWPDDIRGNEHHMGTTRMSDPPRNGNVFHP